MCGHYVELANFSTQIPDDWTKNESLSLHFDQPEQRCRVKGNMDVEISVDAMELAPHVDHVVLFFGDGDFRPPVEGLQRQGVRVSVVSTIRSHPPIIADEPRRQADSFIELDELKDVIGRPPREPHECAG